MIDLNLENERLSVLAEIIDNIDTIQNQINFNKNVLINNNKIATMYPDSVLITRLNHKISIKMMAINRLMERYINVGNCKKLEDLYFKKNSLASGTEHKF